MKTNVRKLDRVIGSLLDEVERATAHDDEEDDTVADGENIDKLCSAVSTLAYARAQLL